MKTGFVLVALALGIEAVEEVDLQNQPCGKGLMPCANGYYCRKLESTCLDLKNDGSCIGQCTAQSLLNGLGSVGNNGAKSQPQSNRPGQFSPPPYNPGPQPYNPGPQPYNPGPAPFNQGPPPRQPNNPPAPRPANNSPPPRQPNNPLAPRPANNSPPPRPANNNPFNPFSPGGNQPPPPVNQPASSPAASGGLAALFGNPTVQPLNTSPCPNNIRCGRNEVCVPNPSPGGGVNAFLCVNGDDECGTWRNKKCPAGKLCVADPRYTCERGLCSGRDGICVPTVPR